jgi:hypothetical protein
MLLRWPTNSHRVFRQQPYRRSGEFSGKPGYALESVDPDESAVRRRDDMLAIRRMVRILLRIVPGCLQTPGLGDMRGASSLNCLLMRRRMRCHFVGGWHGWMSRGFTELAVHFGGIASGRLEVAADKSLSEFDAMIEIEPNLRRITDFQ